MSTISLTKPKSTEVTNVWPQVDLLPPEVRRSRKLSQTKRLLVLMILAVVLLGGQPAGQPGRHLDLAGRVVGDQPSAERAERVHDAVGVAVGGGPVAGTIGVLQHAHAIVLEHDRVVLGVALHGVQAHPSTLAEPRRRTPWSGRATTRRGSSMATG